MSEQTGPLRLGDAARLGLVASVAAALLFSVAVLFEVGLTEAVVCLTATMALVAVSLPLALGRRVALYEPIWLILLAVALGTTATSFFVALGPPDPVRFLRLDLTPEDLVFPTLAIAGGMLCLAVGYLTGGRRRQAETTVPPAQSWNRSRFVLTVGLLLAVGLVSMTVFVAGLEISFDSLSDLSAKRFLEQRSEGLVVRGYLRWGAGLIQVAFLLVFVRWLASRGRLRWRSGLAVALLALLAAAFPFFVSSRLGVLMLILRAVLIWICIRGEPRLRWVLTTVAVALLLLGSMRALRGGVTSWQEFREFVGPGALVEQMVGGRRFLDMTTTAHILNAVPETIDYRYGKTLVTWLVAAVPRAWWPAKPTIGVGPIVGRVALKTPEGVGVPPGMVAELYLNLGLPGVLVGLFAFGLLLGRLSAAFEPYLPGPGFVLVYIMLATRLAVDVFANEVSAGMPRLLQEMLPLLAAIWFCRGRVDSERPPSGSGLART